MWTKTEIDLGRVKEGSRNTVTFIYQGHKQIKARPNGTPMVESGCGCTIGEWRNGILRVTYKASNISSHLSKSEKAFSKHVTVHWQDGTKDVLTVKGIITK